MRKLLTFLIVLGSLVFTANAHAFTKQSTFDFGTAYPERIAFVLLACKSCQGAQSVVVNGVTLKRDVTSGGAEVAEIWSGPLPEGAGVLGVTISSDNPLDDATIGMGAANTPPIKPVSRLVWTAAGQQEYTIDVKDGDVVLSVSTGGSTYAESTALPTHAIEFGILRSAVWNVEWDYSAFKVLAPSPISVVAIYR